MVEFLPHGPVAPRGPIVALRVPRMQLVQQVDVRVRGHRPRYLGGRERALGVHVTPPVDRLYPPHQAQPPVVPEDRPQLRVHPALYPVVGPREGALGRQGRVEVREEQPF